MDPISIAIGGGLVIAGINKIIIEKKRRSRINLIRKIQHQGKQTRKSVDKVSDRHLRNVSRLYDD